MNPSQQDLINLEILAFGQTTVSKFKKYKIFLFGLKGIGVEIAKNIILLGPAQLTIKDDLIVRSCDLTANMFLKESNIGKETRARSCLQGLSQLNQQVQVTIHEGDISEDYIKNFDLIIFTKYYPIDELIALNKFCRSQKKPIGFIMCQTFGVHAYCFIDYGESFKIYDKDGEEPKPYLINEITKACPGVVTLINEKPHNFSDGDFVRIYEVEGMVEVNGTDTRPIKVLSNYSFTIEDTKEFSNYVRGGFVEIAKVPFRVNFKSLEERMMNPFDKKEENDKKNMLHLGFLSLFEFGKKHNTFPEVNNLSHAEELINIAHEIANKHKKLSENGNNNIIIFKNIDDKYIRDLSFSSKTQVIPLCSFWGGIISMELVKFTGKFIPLQEFYHFLALEGPLEINPQKKENNRYEDQISVFGKEVTDRLQKMNILIVGSGACGCEFLKNLALMGVASTPTHSIKIVDEAVLKPTNINSHYWLNSSFLKEQKVKAAASWVHKINENVNVETIATNITEKSDKLFTEEFWKKIDIIICATDDEESRKMLRNKAIWFEKILLDNKIIGTKAHSQVVLPFKTNPFIDEYLLKQTKIDINPETLENFPYLPEHTVFWAKKIFYELFAEFSKELKSFLSDPLHFLQSWDQNERFFDIKLILLNKLFVDQKKINSFEDLVILAKDLFEYLFVYKIQCLFKDHPIDQTNPNGGLFWSGYRKIPKAEEFDLTEETHMNFVIQTSNLLALIINIPQNFKRPNIISIVKSSIQNKSKILQNFEEIGEKPETLIQNLMVCKLPEMKVKVLNVEDDEIERNLCLEFITICSNLKARCYNLVEIQRYKAEKIAFNLERNIGITHQLIAGILCMEIYKIVMEKEKKYFKNTTIDLRCNKYDFVEPSSPKALTKSDEKEKKIPENFDPWKKIEYNKDISIEEFINDFKEKYGVTIIGISFENEKIYTKFSEISQKNILLTSKIEDAYKQVGGDFKKQSFEILVQGVDDLGVTCNFPKIRYNLLK